MNTSVSPSAVPFKAWFELLRIPTVFTAIADVSMAYLVADGALRRVGLWLGLLVVTVCMYWSGMILNDVFDFSVDVRERPDRPLPSKRIARAARRLSWRRC